MALPTGTQGVFAPLNIAGLLFTKTDVKTPLFNMLGGVSVGAREFLCGADYELAAASLSAITETASLTAPTPSYDSPTAAKNVTEIHEKATAASFRKMSNTEALTGLNNEGLVNNVKNPVAFAVANRTAELRNDLEYAILQSTYSLATTPDTLDQTRGLNAAITTNVTAAGGEELSPDMLITVARNLASTSPFGVNGVVGIANAEQIVQFNKIITNEGQRASMTDAGSNLLTYLTPFGRLRFLEGGHRYQTNGTLTFANLSRCTNVLQPVPGYGNFFYLPLARTGAAETGMIYCQWGLNHGHEWMHAKITGLATTTTAYVAPQVQIVGTVATDEVS